MAAPIVIKSPTGPSGTSPVAARTQHGGSKGAAPVAPGYTRPPATKTPVQFQMHSVNDERTRLRNLGYNVDKTGGYTARLHSAIQHAGSALTQSQSVNGRYVVPKAVHDWNAANGIKPTKPGGAGGGRVPPPGSGAGNQTVDDSSVPGQMSPALIQYITDTYGNQSLPKGYNAIAPPSFDPVAYAKNQAEAQFGPVIAQLTRNAAMMSGSEQGAQNNITGYYAPVQADAASAVTSDDAMSAANVAAQQQNTSSGIVGGALQGSAAYGAAQAGALQSGLAGTIGSIQHAGDTARVTNAANDEAQAHVTQGAMDQNSLADIRQQLVSAQTSQGQAQNQYTTDAQSRKQAELGNYVNEESTIQNQKLANGEAVPDILSKYAAFAGANQGLAINKKTLGLQTVASNRAGVAAGDQHAGAVQNLKAQQQAMYIQLHPVIKGVPTTTPWKGVPPTTKQNLLDSFHQAGSMSRLSPQAAYAALKADMQNKAQYTPGSKDAVGIPAFVQQYIKDKYLTNGNNKNWTYDAKTDMFVKSSNAPTRSDPKAVAAAQKAADKKAAEAKKRIFG